jgi:hypothetical protein
MAGFYPIEPEDGSVIKTFQGEAANNTTLAVGDPLTISSGRYGLMSSAGQCDGVCAKAVTGASGATPVIDIWPANLKYRVATETTAPALASHVGTLVDITTATTGAFVVTPGSSTNDDFFVEGIVQKRPENVGVTLAAGDEVYGHFVDTCYNI